MNDAEFWRLVAEFLAAQQSIPGDPSAAVGGDPSANWMDQYAYGQGAIGSYDPNADFDPMADTTIGAANSNPAGLDTSPSSWGQNYPTNVTMRTLGGLQGGLYERQNAMHDANNAERAYYRQPMAYDLQYGLQQHQANPRWQPMGAHLQIQRSTDMHRPQPVAAPTASPVGIRAQPSPAQQVVRTLTQRPVAQPVPRPAPAPVPMARPMPNAVRRTR